MAVTIARRRALPSATVGEPTPGAYTPASYKRRENSNALAASPTWIGVIGVCVLPIENRETLQQGETFDKLSLDHVFSGLDFRPLPEAPEGFAAATKCMCTEHEQRVANFVARVLGPEALLWSDITRGIAYAPGYTIMGGTSNVLRNILGERVLGLPREPR